MNKLGTFKPLHKIKKPSIQTRKKKKTRKTKSKNKSSTIMRILYLIILVVGEVLARQDTAPIQESALMRFLKHPFGLGRTHLTNEDPLIPKPNPAKKDPLYLKTLNRSKCIDPKNQVLSFRSLTYCVLTTQATSLSPQTH